MRSKDYGKSFRNWPTINFFTRFILEYLPLQQSRSKWKKFEENLKEGDIVLIVDDNNPRGKWPMARVTDVKRRRDVLVRTAMVNFGKKYQLKSVKSLVLLEADKKFS